ncbi:MAG: S1C family serine protease, partial [Acidimicrobiales bacterium]
PVAAVVAAEVDLGVVGVDTVLGYESGAGPGTGMILTPNGEILTNNHVVQGATRITVTIVSSGRSYRATVVGTDPTQDVAVLQLQGASGLTPITTASASSLSVGDQVVAIGNAGGTGGTPAVVTGAVTGLNQTITASDQGGGHSETLHGLIQTNAPIQPGDSGGPLANMAGKVVGINTAAAAGMRLSADANVGFAIPVDQAQSIASNIEAGKASSTIHIGLPGFLGVAVAASGRSGLGPGTGNGAVISSVIPGLPAAAAGMQPGDAITSVDGQPVSSSPSLTTLLGGHKPGDKVTVGWSDSSGGSHKATVTLATGPPD